MMPILARPILITTANRVLRIEEGGPPANATIATGVYRLLGNGSSECILTAIKTALESATASANTYSVTLELNPAIGSQPARVRILRLSGSQTLTLLFGDVQTTFPVSAIGFDAVNTAAVTQHVGSFNPDLVWFGGEVLREDERPRSAPVFAQRTGAGIPHAGRRGAARRELRWSVVLVPEDRLRPERIPADPNRAFAGFWERAADGSHIRLGTVAYGTLGITWGDLYVFDLATMEALDAARLNEASGLYSWSMSFWRVPT
jgi:hypothetical protein